MLNKYEFAERIGIDLDTLAYLHATRVTPEPIRVGGECRWRVEDVELFVDYLLARRDAREQGVDPDSVDGPPPPIYSTAGVARFDTRLVIANEREAERQSRSRTLAHGSAPIGPQVQVTLPEVADKQSKVEG